mmetsp:Transcript_13054/g.12906  ORF Transcript_13054/g.12906 Transcript_13054/m.12906 type:complete len:111 (+) Transcript_13054:1236-1568(+)
MTYSLFSSSFVGLIFLYFYDNEAAAPYFLFFLNGATCSFYITLFVANMEVFPRQFISLLMSVCVIVGRCGSSLGPIVAEWEWPTPLLIIIPATFIAGFLDLFLTLQNNEG